MSESKALVPSLVRRKLHGTLPLLTGQKASLREPFCFTEPHSVPGVGEVSIDSPSGMAFAEVSLGMNLIPTQQPSYIHFAGWHLISGFEANEAWKYRKRGDGSFISQL